MSILKAKNVIIILNVFFISFFLLSSILTPRNALADDKYGLDQSASKVEAFKGQVGNQEENFINDKIGSVIGIVLSFIGVIFLILMIYAGISWMTAAGNQEKVTKAKNLIINAIIGLIIVLSAYTISSFIGTRLL
ncbi:MAG: hypothetical protein EOM88_02950 [Clostridia bacterium]|nr:hypothetical protein [Clostridia bacterium]